MPRTAVTRQPAAIVERASDTIRSVSVSQPLDMLDLFKQIASEREAKTKERVPIHNLYTEAVQTMVDEIERGKKIHFITTPAHGTVRRSIWIAATTMQKVSQHRERLNIRASNFVLTALLRFFSKRGITFEGFPEP